MAKIPDAYAMLCPTKCWEMANERANIRISSEYKRDERLDIKQRIEKISIGYIGEFAFKKWCVKNNLFHNYLGETVNSKPDKGDFKCKNDITIDVKTQEVFYNPQGDWRCEVTAEQIKRPIDIYVFAKMLNRNNVRTLFIYGWMLHSDFVKKSSFRVAGSILKGRKVHYPKYDITIENLNDLDSLIAKLK